MAQTLTMDSDDDSRELWCTIWLMSFTSFSEHAGVDVLRETMHPTLKYAPIWVSVKRRVKYANSILSHRIIRCSVHSIGIV